MKSSLKQEFAFRYYSAMRSRKLNTANRIYTTSSGTTIYIDYSEELQILEVEYAGGHVYQYKSVDVLTWEEYRQVVSSGGSSGKFVNTKIKPVYLNYEQIYDN